MGAGVKDSNNNFTGVVMGAVKQNSSAATTYNGLLGFSQGIISIYLDAETGNATFGRPGEGQIKLVPGGTSTIAGWKINIDSLSSNDNKTLLYANESHNGQRFNINNKFIVYSDGRFSAANNKFAVDADGVMTATAGTIGGWTIETNSLHTINKTTFGTSAGAFLGADGKLDFTSPSGNYLRYDGDSFNINIRSSYFEHFFSVSKSRISLGDFVIDDENGRTTLRSWDNDIGISTAPDSGEFWIWCGSDSYDVEDMDFAVNEGGQVYAKDFICTNSAHPYNICQEIAALWSAIESIDTECECGGADCDGTCDTWECGGCDYSPSQCDECSCDDQCYGPGW